MNTERFLMGRHRNVLSDTELRLLEDCSEGVIEYPARRVVVQRGERVDRALLLIDGFMCRYLDDRAGFRQLVSLHVPGDFVDLHGFPMKRLDHDVATIGPVRVATFRHAALRDLTSRHPRLMRMMWFSTLLDAALHREWIFRLGRLGADGRVAHFFCELQARMAMVGLAEDGGFDLPLTQADLAEACGITSVHVNRVLRSLRERRMLTFRSGHVEVLDAAALCALAEFDPNYLYGENTSWLQNEDLIDG